MACSYIYIILVFNVLHAFCQHQSSEDINEMLDKLIDQTVDKHEQVKDDFYVDNDSHMTDNDSRIIYIKTNKDSSTPSTINADNTPPVFNTRRNFAGHINIFEDKAVTDAIKNDVKSGGDIIQEIVIEVTQDVDEIKPVNSEEESKLLHTFERSGRPKYETVFEERLEEKSLHEYPQLVVDQMTRNNNNEVLRDIETFGKNPLEKHIENKPHLPYQVGRSYIHPDLRSTLDRIRERKTEACCYKGVRSFEPHEMYQRTSLQGTSEPHTLSSDLLPPIMPFRFDPLLNSRISHYPLAYSQSNNRIWENPRQNQLGRIASAQNLNRVRSRLIYRPLY